MAASAPAFARNVSIPNGKPALSAVLPDSWKPKATDRGFEATSADGNVYASIEYARDGKADLEKLMEADGVWMTHNKIVPSGASHDRDFRLNGLVAHEIDYDAEDGDGPTKITYTLVELPRDAVGVLTVWGNKEERAPFAKVLSDVLNSVKAIK